MSLCTKFCVSRTRAHLLGEGQSVDPRHVEVTNRAAAKECPLILKCACPTITWNNSLTCFSVQLLVNNKIISLDLPVAEVYKKVWCTTNEVCACLFVPGVRFDFADVCRLEPGGAAVGCHLPSSQQLFWGVCPSPSRACVGKPALVSSSEAAGRCAELQESIGGGVFWRCVAGGAVSGAP